MIKKFVVVQHRILIIAKLGQATLDPMRQMLARLPCVGGKPERAQIAEIVAKTAGDQIKHLLDGVIWSKLHRPRVIHAVRGRFAVVMVVIPLAALGLVAIHQKARLAAHIAVEIFHPQLFAPFGPSREIRMRRDKPVIGQ